MAGGHSKRRRVLHARNPHCFWCGKLTTLYFGPKLKHDTGTVDHLYSRLNPERNNRRRHTVTVLACNQCNQARSHAECTGRSFIPKLARRRATAELTSISPLGADPLPPRSVKIAVLAELPPPACYCYTLYVEQVRNAPDWATTKRLMQARAGWIRTHKCVKPVAHRKVSRRVGIATIGEIVGYYASP